MGADWNDASMVIILVYTKHMLSMFTLSPEFVLGIMQTDVGEGLSSGMDPPHAVRPR